MLSLDSDPQRGLPSLRSMRIGPRTGHPNQSRTQLARESHPQLPLGVRGNAGSRLLDERLLSVDAQHETAAGKGLPSNHVPRTA